MVLNYTFNIMLIEGLAFPSNSFSKMHECDRWTDKPRHAICRNRPNHLQWCRLQWKKL